MDVSRAWEDAKWWSGACEEDTTLSLELDGENGAWARGFLPPPPRPLYLDKDTQSDGLTTCDLCTWATNPHAVLHPSLGDSIASLPWSITLVVVSIVSALLGATLMLTLRRCLKRLNTDRVARLSESNTRSLGGGRDGDKEGEESRGGNRGRGERRGGGLWCWVRRRPPGAAGLRGDVVSASNHYTVDEAYAGVGEALYAELDKPVYQNTGYVLDAESASAPSSAYYSDLSDRTYETVGAHQWEMVTTTAPLTRQPLAAIAESSAVHSDYV